MVLLGLALATPSQLRAVLQQPRDLAELDRGAGLRVFWDGPPEEVQIYVDGRWKTVGDELSSGASVPMAELVRVGGVEVSPSVVLGPSGVARLVEPTSLPGREVADIAPTEQGAWVALLDGGLVQVDKNSLEVRSFGRSEGLPSSEVNAVATTAEGVWAGTAAGLAQVVEGLVRRVWDQDAGLPDDWVQALLPSRDGLWIGTFRGLAELRDDGIHTVLGPQSVFSIVDASDQRAWAGYEGLSGLPQGEPIEGVDPELNVWDVDFQPGTTWLATDTEGVLVLRSGILTPFWSPRGSAAYALQRIGPVLYVAAGEAGLIALTGDGPIQAWGAAEGLPSDTVYEVVEGPRSKLWVGTDDGLSLLWPERDVVVPWPRSPVASGVPAGAVIGDQRYVIFGTDEGLSSVGRPPRGWRDALALPGPIVALCAVDRTLWVVGEQQLWRVHRGRLERFALPVPAQHAACNDTSLWLGSRTGLHRFDGGLGRVVPGPAVGPVSDMEMDPRGMLWAAAGGRVVSVDPTGGTRDYVRTFPPRQVAVGSSAVWVSSAMGLQRLDPFSGEVELVAGLQGPVFGLAVDPDGSARVLTEAGLQQVATGLVVADVPEIWALGTISSLEIDGVGRTWILSERGFSVLAAAR